MRSLLTSLDNTDGQSMVSFIDINEDKIRECLEQAPETSLPGIGEPSDTPEILIDPPRPAAVLVPLVKVASSGAQAEWHLLFTHRTDLVHDHKGQVSFPGGRSDPADLTPENTALREAYEEIGVRASDVHILGRLPHFLTITNYLVTPIVGTLPWPYAFMIQPSEVSRVFTIPLEWLADLNHFQVHQRELPPDFPTPIHFRRVNVIYFEPYDGEVLWGATASVTVDFLQIIGLLNKTGAGK